MDLLGFVCVHWLACIDSQSYLVWEFFEAGDACVMCGDQCVVYELVAAVVCCSTAVSLLLVARTRVSTVVEEGKGAKCPAQRAWACVSGCVCSKRPVALQMRSYDLCLGPEFGGISLACCGTCCCLVRFTSPHG
jgi:hypothetical protein